MNGPSGFQEVRSSAPRPSTNRLLHEQPHRFGKVPGAVSVLLMLLAFAGHFAFHTEQAHGVTSITHTTGAGDLGTQVLLPIGHVYGITGGTPAGTNLYHSFAQFNVGTGDIAQFQTGTPSPNTAMLNILGRITDANPSTIFGTIDSASFYPNANLFLMNPYGFLFGPGAMVNVGGMVAFTTADYLRLTNDVRFEAIPGGQDVLLSAFPVSAFGFLGLNPSAIAVQGSQLTVANGTGLSLVGGNQGFTAIDPDTGNPISVPGGVTMTGGTLSAPGHQINLASVASPGEVSAGDFMPTSGMTMGNVSLSQAALLDVSADVAGTVRIRGGQFVIDGATISADTINADGAPVAIDINVTDNVSISTIDVPALTTRTTGTGNAGKIAISSGSMDITGTTLNNFAFSMIDTHTTGSGKAGDVSITTGDLTVAGDPFAFAFVIDSGTNGPEGGHGGDVVITAHTIQAQYAMLTTGTFNTEFFLDPLFTDNSTGSAGNVTISADSLNMSFAQIATDASSFRFGTGRAGDITVTAHDINLDNSAFSSAGQESGGAITIDTDHLFAADSQIVAQTNLTPGGAVTITGKVLELTTGSSVVSGTGGDGDAGSIHITATDHLGLLRASATDRPSGIFSNSFGSFGSAGNAGDIVINTPKLEMTGGSRINTTTATSGHGGNVTINATDSISMSGETGSFAPEPLFSLGGIQSSGIFTRTIGGKCSGPCGDSGNISITTGSLTLDTGGQINSGTSTSGHGGEITIHATDTISLSGTLSDGTPVGVLSRTIGTTPDAGSGGNVAISAGQSVTISAGASISASSTGAGDAGNVTVQGLASPAQSMLIDGTNSGIFTDTQGTGAGGNIFVNANTVTLQNGGAISAQTSGTGNAGNITIIADQVSLTNLSELTTSTSGQGSGGTIHVSAEDTISAVDSFISASSNSTGPGAGSGGQVILNASTIDVVGGDISTLTVGAGNAGDIQIQAGTFRLGTSENAFGLVEATTSGSGHGGNISILGIEGSGSRANDVILSDFSSLRSETLTDGAGTAGNITVDTVRLTLREGSDITTASHLNSPGNAGNVTLDANESVLVSGSFVSSDVFEGSTGNGGQVTIKTPNLIVNQGSDGTRGIISTNTGSSGNAGSVTINANSVTLADGGRLTSSSFLDDPFYPPATGAAGNVVVQGLNGAGTRASSIAISGQDGSGAASGIFTNTDGSGPGGNMTLSVNTVTLQNGGTLSAATSGTAPSATGGTITIQGSDVQLKTGSIVTAETFGSGAGGKVTISADQRVTVADSFILTSAVPEFGEGGAGGDIVLNAPILSLEDSGLFASTSSTGKAGDVALQGQQITLASNTVVATSTDGQGAAGTIRVEGLQGPGSRATSVTLSNSRIESETTGNLGSEGPAGNIFVETARLMLTDSQFSTRSSFSPGNAGQLVMNASNQIQLVRSNITSSSEGAVTDAVTGDPIQTGDAGEIVMSAPHIIVEDASKVTTNTEFTGQAGNITLNTANLEVRSGAQITSSSSAPESSPTGNAGTVTVQDLASRAQSVLIDGPGSGIFTDTQGTGVGGNILINANSVTLQNGGTLSAKTLGTVSTATGGTITVDAANTITMNSASITAKSAGVADAGSIDLTAMNGFTMQDSTITTQAGQGAGGGNIKVTTSPSATVLLESSLISASVADGRGGGGNISIDPQFVILQNSQILAQAAQGQGGAITIIANLFLSDANSIVNADSGSGVNGTITIQSPNAPISGQIQPLGKTPLIATSLLNQHCAALAGGQFSSFTVAGRDSLPIEPGSWLASPLYAAGVGTGEGLSGLSSLSGVSRVVRAGLAAHQIDQPLLSLRRIAPAGFLTQAFAVDEPAGCQS